jgi:hypothetical protein
MSGYFFDFAKQNQKNNHSFKMFFGGVSRQGSFETASQEGVFRAVVGALGRADDRHFQEGACKSKPYSFEGILIFLVLIRKIKKMSIHSLFYFAAEDGERLLRKPPVRGGEQRPGDFLHKTMAKSCRRDV